MKIIDKAQYGPMFRFNDSNVYWALYILSDGKKMGRKKLAENIGIGEGSMRRILDTLKSWEMVNVKQTGITITRTGTGFLSDLPMKVINLDVGDAVVGKYRQAVLVEGVSHKIENGMQQRDEGIKVGASGCTTILYRNGALTIPPDWNLDIERPELAQNIRNDICLGEKDIIIVGGADNIHSAVNAALSAAFELF